jgi:hypothetical protein
MQKHAFLAYAKMHDKGVFHQKCQNAKNTAKHANQEQPCNAQSNMREIVAKIM